MSQDLSTIARWLLEAQTTVAFTGAGISTESGIPDFRSPGGVWSKNRPVYFDEFLHSAESRREYWRQKAEAHADFIRAQPNPAHSILARWESENRLNAVITQNIDGLHQLAGSRTVYELHGTAREVACLDCHFRSEADPLVRQFNESRQVPLCPQCSGRLKHATISFGQRLPEEILNRAVELAQQADVFLALGSSLVVEPAASLPLMAKQSGARLIIVNRDPTPLDEIADSVLHEAIGQTMTRIDAAVQELFE